MSKLSILLILLLALFFSACSQHAASNAVMGGLGAAVGSQLGDGDPLITAAGAASGVIVSELMQNSKQKAAASAFTKGYDRGRSDAVKQQYWVMVQQQKASEESAENFSLYEIPLPEQHIDGVILQPTTRVLRIQE